MKSIVVLSVVTLLGACSPGHVALNNGKAEYVWIGCHVVTESPKNGEYAVGPVGDLKVGDTFYFKQVGSDGKIGKVVTGKPCED
jgi:hypothetical protein